VDASSSPSFWDLVDAVLVINLASRPERWAELQAATRGLIPPAKLHRIEAVLGRDLPAFGRPPWFRGRSRDLTWAARGGCTLSHRLALETARRHGWATVLILEDDVAFADSFAALDAALRSVLTLPRIDWQICYLGYTDPVSPYRTLAPLGDHHQLAQIYGCNCAHAYLIRAEARDWLLAHMPIATSVWPWLARHRAVDRWYRGSLGRHFQVIAVSPSLINQRAGFSDIVHRSTDYLHNGVHRLSVPARSSFAAIYTLCLHCRRLAQRGHDIYDFLRSLRKHLRGF
jgi:glycosyl transferase, family 25